MNNTGFCQCGCDVFLDAEIGERLFARLFLIAQRKTFIRASPGLEPSQAAGVFGAMRRAWLFPRPPATLLHEEPESSERAETHGTNIGGPQIQVRHFG